jgi:hypothetical protein
MKIWKLVSGILSIAMFLIISFQSCAVGLVNIIDDNEADTSGAGGALVAFFLLVAGIVSTVLWKKISKGGDIALIIIYGLAALMGFSNLGTFSDLAIWSSWALICAILAAVSLIKNAAEIDDYDNERVSFSTVNQNSSPKISTIVANNPTKECPNCHAQIDINSKFCNICGTKLPDQYFCKNCGEPLEPDYLFCTKCGTKRN